MRRVPAPTVVILAAGEGTRMRSAAAEGPAPALRAADDRCGRSLAAREAGAGRVVVVDDPKRRLAAHLPDDVEVAIQERAARHRRRRRAPPPAQIDADAPVLVVNGDVPLITAEAIARAGRTRTTSAGAAATIATMELDDPTGYGRVVRDADGSVERVVETKAAGRRDRRASSRSARSTPASTRSTAARCSTRSSRLDADNAQGELYLPDVLPAAARATARPSPAHVARRSRRSRSASTTASTSPHVTRARPAAHPRARTSAPA